MRRRVLGGLAVLFGVYGLICILLFVFGLRPFVLESESMEPLYRVGSLCLINTRVESGDVKAGDVIVYRANSGALVMHRYLGEGFLKGDANEEMQAVDLTPVNFIGREVFTLPYIGTPVGVLLSYHWIVWVLAGGVLIWAAVRKE